MTVVSYYAIEWAGRTRLLRVDKPEHGKWAGHTFVVEVDRQTGVLTRPRPNVARAWLNIIEMNPLAASERYGRETAHCGVCGRKLENDDSKKRGIGPICAQKF